MNQDIEQIKKDIQELKQWKSQRELQQINFPLDITSQNILSQNIPVFVSTINTTGAGGKEFPFALVLKVNGIYYYLSLVGQLDPFAVNTTTNVLSVGSTNYVNGDSVVFYTQNVAPSPLVAGGGATYYVKNVSGNTFQVSTGLNVVFTVSGVTITPTLGAVYSDGRHSYTVTTTSISGGAGTVSCTADGSPYQYPSIIVSKSSGTGDSTLSASSWTANGDTAVDITSVGIGSQYISHSLS